MSKSISKSKEIFYLKGVQKNYEEMAYKFSKLAKLKRKEIERIVDEIPSSSSEESSSESSSCEEEDTQATKKRKVDSSEEDEGVCLLTSDEEFEKLWAPVGKVGETIDLTSKPSVAIATKKSEQTVVSKTEIKDRKTDTKEPYFRKSKK